MFGHITGKMSRQGNLTGRITMYEGNLTWPDEITVMVEKED